MAFCTFCHGVPGWRTAVDDATEAEFRTFCKGSSRSGSAISVPSNSAAQTTSNRSWKCARSRVQGRKNRNPRRQPPMQTCALPLRPPIHAPRLEWRWRSSSTRVTSILATSWKEQEARSFPSDDQAQALTPWSWPWRVRGYSPVAASQSLIVVSTLAVERRVPSGLQPMRRIAFS
jgi:hypothetical protein